MLTDYIENNNENEDSTKEELLEEMDFLRALIGELRIDNYKVKKENEKLQNDNNRLRMCNEVLLHNFEENESEKPVSNPLLADLELTEDFLTNKEVEENGYDPNEMEKAYMEAQENYRF